MGGLVKLVDMEMVSVPAKVLDQIYVRDHRNCRLLLHPLSILFVSSSLITPEDRHYRNDGNKSCDKMWATLRASSSRLAAPVTSLRQLSTTAARQATVGKRDLGPNSGYLSFQATLHGVWLSSLE